jgi:hypothetical protein
MIIQIECIECGIDREIEDEPQALAELASRHATEYGHDVDFEVVNDE